MRQADPVLVGPPIPQADVTLMLSHPGSGDRVWAAFIQLGRRAVGEAGPKLLPGGPEGQILGKQAAGPCRLHPPSFPLQTFPELPTVLRPLSSPRRLLTEADPGRLRFLVPLSSAPPWASPGSALSFGAGVSGGVCIT